VTGALAPEFSRVVSLARLGSEPFRLEITADEAERKALARRFDLFALDRLFAAVELQRQGSALILLRADFEAEFVQNCVVTLDPVGGALSQRFSLLYGPPGAEEQAGGPDDERTFEPLTAAAIDIGEAVAQEFSLALPAFPRSPDACVEAEPPPQDAAPFAVLSRLADRPAG
jgi:uncharacterized metal-binding protein YceD (DUF177 family)